MDLLCVLVRICGEELVLRLRRYASTPLSPYAPATRCPVPTSQMALSSYTRAVYDVLICARCLERLCTQRVSIQR
eukprot:1485702-Rhodomonas_salina.1